MKSDFVPVTIAFVAAASLIFTMVPTINGKAAHTMIYIIFALLWWNYAVTQRNTVYSNRQSQFDVDMTKKIAQAGLFCMFVYLFMIRKIVCKGMKEFTSKNNSKFCYMKYIKWTFH